MQPGTKIKIFLTTVTLLLFFSADFIDFAEARVRVGGRSFSRSRSVSRPAAQPRRTATNPTARSTNPLGGVFGRGLAGGLLGGFIGSMLFGGMAHGAGAGGFGGSGIGFLEILLLAGLAYFLFKKFSRRRAPGVNSGAGPIPGPGPANQLFTGLGARQSSQNDPGEDPLVAGVKKIWQFDDGFDPDAFKDTAQDLFFNIQAGWTRRDVDVLKDCVGDQLLQEYDRHFAQMRRDGHINRLENIAVRKVDLVAAGVQGHEIFATVKFTANLLDYTVDEGSGQVVAGDRENPVKFEEEWSFAHPIGDPRWKLEGIDG